MYQGVDIATTYHAFISKSDINMRALLESVQVNKSQWRGQSQISKNGCNM